MAGRLSGRSRRGGRPLKDTYLGAQFSRLRGRLGHAKARTAVGRSILVAAFHILDRHVPYHVLGADWFAKRRPEAHARRLARQIEALGYRVTFEPLAAA